MSGIATECRDSSRLGRSTAYPASEDQEMDPAPLAIIARLSRYRTALGNDLARLALDDGKNRLWLAAPAQKQLDRDGQPRLDANGRPVYRALIEFRNRRIAERFNAAVLDALRREHPYALAGQASS